MTSRPTPPPAGLVARRGGPEDEASIAGLQILSWQVAYRGLLDQDFLICELPDALGQYWRTAFEGRDPRDAVLLLCAPDGIAGFVALGRSSASATEAFVDHLHVRPDLRGRRIGRWLLGQAAGEASAQGRCGVYLNVLATNAPALAFYRRMGGTVGRPFRDTILGLPVEACRVDWPDAAELRRLCHRPREAVKQGPGTARS